MKMVIYIYIYITYSSIRFELFVFCIYFSNISNKNVISLCISSRQLHYTSTNSVLSLLLPPSPPTQC